MGTTLGPDSRLWASRVHCSQLEHSPSPTTPGEITWLRPCLSGQEETLRGGCDWGNGCTLQSDCRLAPSGALHPDLPGQSRAQIRLIPSPCESPVHLWESVTLPQAAVSPLPVSWV